MTAELPLRDKDWAVLQCINEGKDDIQKITSTITLENHEVNYCFTKLEKHGLIHVEKPNGYTTRTINGQKRTFRTPKQAQLTPHGKRALEQNQPQDEDIDQYKNLTHRELVKKVHRLETDISQLKNSFDTFRQQVVENL